MPILGKTGKIRRKFVARRVVALGTEEYSRRVLRQLDLYILI